MMDNLKLEMIEAKAGAMADMGHAGAHSPPVLVRLAEDALELAAVTDEERDELACLLTGYDFEDWAVRPVRSPMKYYSIKDADRLIAAGYRKVVNNGT